MATTKKKVFISHLIAHLIEVIIILFPLMHNRVYLFSCNYMFGLDNKCKAKAMPVKLLQPTTTIVGAFNKKKINI